MARTTMNGSNKFVCPTETWVIWERTYIAQLAQAASYHVYVKGSANCCKLMFGLIRIPWQFIYESIMRYE